MFHRSDDSLGGGSIRGPTGYEKLAIVFRSEHNDDVFFDYHQLDKTPYTRKMTVGSMELFYFNYRQGGKEIIFINMKLTRFLPKSFCKIFRSKTSENQ